MCDKLTNSITIFYIDIDNDIDMWIVSAIISIFQKSPIPTTLRPTEPNPTEPKIELHW